MTTSEGTGAVDGRRARRERGRLAVLDAMVDLLREGRTPPTTQELAERAGVSAASIFRYFDGLDELRGHTIVHFLGRYQGLFEVPPATGTLDERITSYVDSRLRLYETIAPVARMVRARMYDEPQLAEQLHRVRRQQAEQARAHFAVELDPLAVGGLRRPGGARRHHDRVRVLGPAHRRPRAHVAPGPPDVDHRAAHPPGPPARLTAAQTGASRGRRGERAVGRLSHRSPSRSSRTDRSAGSSQRLTCWRGSSARS